MVTNNFLREEPNCSLGLGYVEERQLAIERLHSLGLTALSVATAQDPERYPARKRNGEIKRDRNGKIQPAFNGKNPSYIDECGKPHQIYHKHYQNRQPSEQEIKVWFANSQNGIGVLGKSEFVLVDWDAKRFSSIEESDLAFDSWISRYPQLAKTWIERTTSGGYRLLLWISQQNRFSRFTLTPDGKHVGEILGDGCFAVLAPTIGASGKPYVAIKRNDPIQVDSLAEIGIYPVSKPRKLSPKPPVRVISSSPKLPDFNSNRGIVRLEHLISKNAVPILQGYDVKEDSSESLTTLAREAYGWQNWCRDNAVAISGDAITLVYQAGEALGLDKERVNRILDSTSNDRKIEESLPGVRHFRGDAGCWNQVNVQQRRSA